MSRRAAFIASGKKEIETPKLRSLADVQPAALSLREESL